MNNYMYLVPVAAVIALLLQRILQQRLADRMPEQKE